MKYSNLLSVLFLFNLFFSCKSMTEEDDQQYIFPADFDMEKWLDENTVPKHKNLKSFELISEYDLNLEPFTEQENTVLPSTQIQFSKDSITAFFYQTIGVGCPIIGNISIENDTVKLLYDMVCHPKANALINEEIKFKLKYVLKNDAVFKHKIWKAEMRNLQLKSN